MSTDRLNRSASIEPWVRIPNGTKVRHRTEAYDGIIDGLTEIVSGTDRNPDGKTQYRVNVGDNTRLLVSEDHLNILLDDKNLVMVGRESELYRRSVTNRLRAVFSEDRFIVVTKKQAAAVGKQKAVTEEDPPVAPSLAMSETETL